MRIPAQPKVIIRSCRAYDPEAIRTIIREGLEELGLRPFGRTLVKPNLVAAGPLFPYAYTRPEFGEGVLRALRDVGGASMTELAAGERCGITVPTRVPFRESGWDDMLGKLDVKRYCFEEEQQVEIPLSHEKRLRDYLFTPEPVARADFFVNCPKFKAHPWTTVTFSMKNYIGIQDDRHRLIDHDHKLNEKIADLQHIIQPQFIAIDAITAGEGRMLTPTPFDLGLIIMGNSQVAFDAVCCNIIGVDPMSVDHIRLAVEYGFGTTDLSKIAITGDVTLEGAKARAKGFKVGLIRVEKYFEGTNITAYAGPPPEPEHGDYCWGGCPGAIEEAIEILRQFDKHTDAKMPRLHVVFGAYEGEIPAKPGEKVVFIGDCANWKGQINGKPIAIENLYKERSTMDPHAASQEDIFVKLTKAGSKLRGDVIRLEGCPVSVSEQVLALVGIGKLDNPFLDPSQAAKFTRGYLGWKSRVMLNRLKRKSYQKDGSFPERGQAAPELRRRKAMIGPGCLPSYRPRVGLKRRTLSYTPLPRRSRPRVNKAAPSARTSNTEIVLFDHGPAVFPVATVMPREPRARAIVMLAAFQRWLLARWTWLRPRTIPCAVAMLGMLAVIWSADYLAHQYDDQIGAARIALPHGGESVHVRISAP